MQTLYAMSSGEYSDYRVHALFTTRDLAEQAAQMFGRFNRWSRPFVEEYQVYDAVQNPIAVLIIAVDLAPNGRVLHEHTWTNHVWPWEGDEYRNQPDAEVKVGQWAPSLSYQSAARERRLPIRSSGTNHEKVAKVLNDTVARIRAELEGLA